MLSRDETIKTLKVGSKAGTKVSNQKQEPRQEPKAKNSKKVGGGVPFMVIDGSNSQAKKNIICGCLVFTSYLLV